MLIIPKKFSIEDINERVQWINNSAVHETMFFQLPATLEQTKKWYSSNIDNNSRIDFVFKSNTGDYLAMGGFTGISQEHQNGEFYVMVKPGFQGQGIGKHVSRWMYNYAFSILKLHKIYLYTNDDNIAAAKIYENAGFVLEGVLREHKVKGGCFQNRRVYGLLKKEWDSFNWKEQIDAEL